MADFLREIRDISILNLRRDLKKKGDSNKIAQARGRAPEIDDALPDITVEYPERGAFMPDTSDDSSSFADGDSIHQSQATYDEQDLGGQSAFSGLIVLFKNSYVCDSLESRARRTGRPCRDCRNPSATT